LRPKGSDILFELKTLDHSVRKLIDAHAHCVEAEPLTRMHHWIIGYLFHHGDEIICQREVETEFRISRSTTSGMLALMEKKGLITRAAVQHDARLKQIRLTEKAVQMHQTQMARMAQIDALVENSITNAEREEFLRVIRKISAALKTGLDNAQNKSINEETNG